MFVKYDKYKNFNFKFTIPHNNVVKKKYRVEI